MKAVEVGHPPEFRAKLIMGDQKRRQANQETLSRLTPRIKEVQDEEEGWRNRFWGSWLWCY